MDENYCREQLNILYTATLVPIHVFRKWGHVCSASTYREEDMSWESFLLILKEKEDLLLNAGLLWQDREYENICYGAIPLPEEGILVAGPFSPDKLQYPYLHAYKKAKGFLNIEVPHFSLSRIAAFLRLAGEVFSGKKLPIKRMIKERQKADASQEYLVQQYCLDRIENGKTHHSASIEQIFGEYIMNGDTEGLFRLIEGVHAETVGQMSNSDIKQAEYAAVLIVAIAAKYAIKGGVDQYLAYDISDLFLQELSRSRTQTQFQKIEQAAIMRLTEEVKRARKLAIGNLYVQKCKEYIYLHLNKPFQVKDIAEEIGISPVYLSQVFTQEQGETIKSYILRQRIRLAQNMLKFSDYKISAIAEYLCFNSQSHFGVIFKKLIGITPDAYRKQNQCSDYS